MKIQFSKRIVFLLVVSLVVVLFSGIRYKAITGTHGSGFTLGLRYTTYHNLIAAFLILLIIVGIIKSEW